MKFVGSVLIVLLTAGALAGAHEIGTTRVAADFTRDGRYAIDIVTDATALLEKLDILAGEGEPEAAYTHLSAAALATRLSAREDVFRQRVSVNFDGVAHRPEVRFDVAVPPDAALPPFATIRLSGEVPSGRRGFTWEYGWTFSSYSLSSRAGVEWLEGGQTSALVPLPPPASPFISAARYATVGLIVSLLLLAAVCGTSKLRASVKAASDITTSRTATSKCPPSARFTATSSSQTLAT